MPGRNRVYAALYKDGLRLSEYLDISIANLLALLDGEVEARFVGPDADLFAEYALERPGFIVEADNPERKLRGLISFGGASIQGKGRGR